MAHILMGGKYKSAGECGGSRHGGLEEPDSKPRTHQRPRDAIQIVHLSILVHEMPPGKAMEQIWTTVVQDFPNYKHGFQKLQFQL